jgi:hypothetical protein
MNAKTSKRGRAGFDVARIVAKKFARPPLRASGRAAGLLGATPAGWTRNHVSDDFLFDPIPLRPEGAHCPAG